MFVSSTNVRAHMTGRQLTNDTGWAPSVTRYALVTPSNCVRVLSNQSRKELVLHCIIYSNRTLVKYCPSLCFQAQWPNMFSSSCASHASSCETPASRSRCVISARSWFAAPLTLVSPSRSGYLAPPLPRGMGAIPASTKTRWTFVSTTKSKMLCNRC